MNIDFITLFLRVSLVVLWSAAIIFMYNYCMAYFESRKGNKK